MRRDEFETIIKRVTELAKADGPADLRRFLETLDLETLVNLVSVMYCGRDGYLNLLGFRDSVASESGKTELVRILIEKRGSLPRYFKDGIEDLGRQFDDLLSRPPSTPPQRETPDETDSLDPQPTRLPSMKKLPVKKEPEARQNPPPNITGYSEPRLLGAGGSGRVFRYTAADGTAVAVKVYAKAEGSPRLSRFYNEVEVMTRFSGDSESGVVPLLGSNLDSPPRYYIMPLGAPATAAFELTLSDGMKALAGLASALASLHAQNIFHRDISPDNLLKIDGRWYFADFGLADFPEARAVTTDGEEIGPPYSKPPEMRRTAAHAAGGPADVYLFAKTIWMLLCGEPSGFDGRYDSDILHLSLTRRFPQDGMAMIEFALHRATAYDPSERLTMVEFARVLNQWVDVRDDFHRRIRLEWESSISRLFPSRTPHRVEWVDNDTIAQVLAIVSQTAALNHMFFPNGGGTDLESVSVRDGGIVLWCGAEYFLKPKRLELVIWAEAPEWSYLYLEVADLEPTGDGVADGFIELLAAFPAGVLRHPDIYYRGGEYIEDAFVPLPGETKLIHRILRGNIVFFGKASTYNAASSTYDGRHHKMGREGFYEHVKILVAHVDELND